jgi:hypothetical protein
MKYVLLIGSSATLLIMTSLKFQKKKWNNSGILTRIGVNQKEIVFFSSFLGFILVLIVLEILDLQIKSLNLLTLLYSIFLILRIANQYAIQNIQSVWNHPTTYGSIIQATLVLGAGLSIIIYSDPIIINTLGWFLLVVIVLQGLSLWTRFRYLGRSSQLTRRAIEMMLGSYLTLFGVRFIFGLVMPLVYLFWSLVIKSLPLHPISLMVFVGELSERILFFITSDALILNQSATGTSD